MLTAQPRSLVLLVRSTRPSKLVQTLPQATSITDCSSAHQEMTTDLAIITSVLFTELTFAYGLIYTSTLSLRGVTKDESAFLRCFSDCTLLLY